MNISPPVMTVPSFSEITVNLPTTLLNEEELVSLAENEWLGRARRLPSSERDEAINRIKTMAKDILNKLDRMLHMGCSSEQIRVEAVKSIKQLHITSEKLFQGYTSYCRNKNGLENDFNGLHSKIQLASLNFSPFVSSQTISSTNPTSIFQNFLHSKSEEQLQIQKTLTSSTKVIVQSTAPAKEREMLYNARQSGIEESMGLARVLGSIINAASFLISEGAKSNRKDIEANNKAFQELLYACHITSKKEPLAGRVLNPKQVVYVDDWVEDLLIRTGMEDRFLPIYKKLKRPSFALAYQLKTQFGISEERTKQFEEDAFHITLTAIPLPSLGASRFVKGAFIPNKFSSLSSAKRNIFPIFKPNLNKNKMGSILKNKSEIKLTHKCREERVYPKEKKLIKVEKTAHYVDKTYQFTWPSANYTTAIRKDGTFIAIVGNVNNTSLTSVTREFKNGARILLKNNFEHSERSTFMLAQKIFFEVKEKAKKAFKEKKCLGTSFILEFEAHNPRILKVMKARYNLINRSKISSLVKKNNRPNHYQFEIPLNSSEIYSKLSPSRTGKEKSIKNFIKEELGAIPLSGLQKKPLSKKIEDRIAKLEKLQEIVKVPQSKRKMIQYHKKIGYQIVEKGGKGSHVKLEKWKSPMAIISDVVETYTYDAIWKRFKITLGNEIVMQKKLLQEAKLQENMVQPFHNVSVLGENLSIEECFKLSLPRNKRLKKKLKGERVRSSLAITDCSGNNPKSQKIMPILKDPILVNEKKRQRLLNYQNGVEVEQFVLQELSSSTPVFQWPASLPRHIKEFYADFKTNYFNASKLGSSGKGKIKGQILYKNTPEETLFILQSRTSSDRVKEKLGGFELIRSVHLSWDERLAYLIDQTLSFSVEQGFKRIFLAWDPVRNPLAAVMTRKEGVTILGINQFSAGINQRPFMAVELGLPEVGTTPNVFKK